MEPFLYREGSTFKRIQVKCFVSIEIVKKNMKPRHFVVFLENLEPSLYREDSTFHRKPFTLLVEFYSDFGRVILME